MNDIHRKTLILTFFLGALLFQGQSYGAECGGNRDAYLGTYKGRVTWDVVPPYTPQRLAKDPLLKLLADKIPLNNYTLTVRFYKEGSDYWAESTVKFDNPTVINLDPGYTDRSGYVLNLISDPSKVQFTVTEKRSVTVGQKSVDITNITPLSVKNASRSGTSISFMESFAMEALDCAPGSNVPRKLRQNRTHGTNPQHVRKRELTRVN